MIKENMKMDKQGRRQSWNVKKCWQFPYLYTEVNLWLRRKKMLVKFAT